jgi:hypothetical protein
MVLYNYDGTTVRGQILKKDGTAVVAPAVVSPKILQVVTATYATQVSNSTSTYADTGLTATITPTLSTSKILVIINQSGLQKSSGNGNNQLAIKLLRGATDLGVMLSQGLYTASATTDSDSTYSIHYEDSPATTSATTYKTQFANAANAANVTVQNASSVSSITLMEIAA